MINHNQRLTADETVTVRLPQGTAARLRAATGQPFSRLMRFLAMEMLKKYETAADAKAQLRSEAASVVAELGDQPTEPTGPTQE